MIIYAKHLKLYRKNIEDYINNNINLYGNFSEYMYLKLTLNIIISDFPNLCKLIM